MSIERRHFNDLEQPLTQSSRSCHSLTLTISQTAKDTAIVAIQNANMKPYRSFRMVPQTQISKSRHYLTVTISQTVRDTDIVTTKYYGTYALLRSVISNYLE